MTNLVFNHESYEEFDDFIPIPGLFNPDGDTVLVFLTSNGIEFWDATSDPWYRTTVRGDISYMLYPDKEVVLYRSEEAASPMGCVRQFQFCNPSLSSNNCGPLVSWADAQAESAHLFGITEAEMQKGSYPTSAIGSRYAWFAEVLTDAQGTIESVILNLGPDALASIKYLGDGIMGPLPSDQWQLDVRYWWATYLASIQAAVVNTAHGPTDAALAPYSILPFDSHVREMCNNQVRCLNRACQWSSADMKCLTRYRRSEVPSMSPSASSAFTSPWSLEA